MDQKKNAFPFQKKVKKSSNVASSPRGSYVEVQQKAGEADVGFSTSKHQKVVKNTQTGPSISNAGATAKDNKDMPMQDVKSFRSMEKIMKSYTETGGEDVKKKTRRRERKPKRNKEPVRLISVHHLPETSATSSPVSSSTPRKVNDMSPRQSLVPEVETKMILRISRVRKPSKYLMYKTRNTRYRYVNLWSFVGRSTTYVFKSEIPRLAKLSFKNDLHLKSSLSKIHKRKYPVARAERHYLSEPSTSKGVSQVSELVRKISLNSLLEASDVNTSAFDDSSTSCIDATASQSELDESKSPKKRKTPRPKKKEKHLQQKLLKQLEKETAVDFPPYYSEQEVKEGLEKGELIKGFLRVNPKNAKDSYISNEDTSLSDYYITSVADRNRGLDGDEVVIKVKPKDQWKEGKSTAVVVYILQKINPRTMTGTLVPNEEDKDSEFGIFRARDKRMPLCMISKLSWPAKFKTDPKLYQKTLFLAKMLEWEKPAMATGVILESLGLSGDLRVETQSILKEFQLDTTPFSPDIENHLPKSMAIPKEEVASREDIRKECVFTIDPFTARDLDDAVSVKKLSNGHYEVGVHISDASYYLKEGTELDKLVCGKATTIYLVDNVYHMLPVELCLHCSLLPGADKLAFSVFWEMDESGKIYNTRFSRTVINSCVQLAYEHAQVMIENPNKEYTSEELPHIHNNFTAQDLSDTVNVLQTIAVNLRNSRIQNGSLRIDQVKLLFSLDPTTGEPTDFKVYENKEAHRLIEEFMLLANISVAKKISDSFPDLAFLRCHEPPKYAMLREAQQVLESCGILIDVSSSGGIHSSLRKYITDDFEGQVRSIVLNHIFTKPMTRARYFCASTMASPLNYSHYALSVPIYTHFTSPIRRYADIMVHRLLAASLGYSGRPNWTAQSVQEVAANCNKQKYNAKRAGEASSDLYLAHYIDKHQPYYQDCVVIDVRERSFDAIVLSTGSLVRIYQKRCEDKPTWTIEAIPLSQPRPVKARDREIVKKVFRLTIKYRKTRKCPQEQTQIVEMFSVVKVKLQRKEGEYKLDAYLKRPMSTMVFHRRGNTSLEQKNIKKSPRFIKKA